MQYMINRHVDKNDGLWSKGRATDIQWVGHVRNLAQCHQKNKLLLNHLYFSYDVMIENHRQHRHKRYRICIRLPVPEPIQESQFAFNSARVEKYHTIQNLA